MGEIKRYNNPSQGLFRILNEILVETLPDAVDGDIFLIDFFETDSGGGAAWVPYPQGRWDKLPIGKWIAHKGTNIPSGMLICDGRTVERDEYPELYEKIGTDFGSGDGITTFNLPDLPQIGPDAKYIICAKRLGHE